MKYKPFYAFIFLPLLITSCNSFAAPEKGTIEDTRFTSMRTMENYSWSYYTEIPNSDSSTGRIKNVFIGEGTVTSLGASTYDNAYSVYVYSLTEIEQASQNEGTNLEDYLKNNYLGEKDFYEINYEKQEVVINRYRSFSYKCFVKLDENGDRHYSSYLIFMGDQEPKLEEDRILKSSEPSMMEYLTANDQLLKEVIQSKNATDENSYYVKKPSSPFYFADSKMIMTAHKIDSIKFTFENNIIKYLDYVRDGREINVTFSNVGTTVLEKPNF